ncbi:MAG: glycosyltransferase [Candidatus Latescibacterota bacterium]
MLKNQEIIYIGNDWFADNKTSSHQIAGVLSKYNTLLYVEAAGQRAPRASRRDIHKIFKKLWSAWNAPAKVQDNLYRYSPLILPFHKYGFVRKLNKFLLARFIKRACKKVGFSDPLLWIILPHYASLLDSIECKGIVYYVVDEYSALPDVDVAMIRTMEEHVLQKANVVFVVSEELLERKSKLNKNTYLSPHGVDTAHFNKALNNDTIIPGDIAGIGKPVIGFVGLIEKWVDLNLIEYLARKRPALSFVLIGRVVQNITRFRTLDNVHFLGQREYAAVPSYIKYFDACLIPFELNDVIISSNPLKLKEYLAAGKPVVSVAIREVEKYGDVAYISNNYDEFLRCIDRALSEDSPEKRTARVKAMEMESWTAKVERICEYVHQHIEGSKDVA